jgi:hypothetical protein
LPGPTRPMTLTAAAMIFSSAIVRGRGLTAADSKRAFTIVSIDK